MSRRARNDLAKDYITNKLDQAEKLNESYFVSLTNYYKVSKMLDDLIDVRAMGFRGIVATALAGLYINPNYDPLNDFYSCNPRSIFEKGIFYAFQGRIPCGKSDPLNVAKNQYILNESWAAGKRPQKSAMAAVNFLSEVLDNTLEQDKLIDFYFYRMVEYSRRVKSILIEIPNDGMLSHQEIGHRLVEFMYSFPESGTIPQYVVSLLIKANYEKSSLLMEGGDESVFGTNTTSKKPADIWVEEYGEAINLYEVTVKNIDIKRLDDSLEALHDIDMLDKNIHFICRLPEDVKSLKGFSKGTYKHRGKAFNFIDLHSFVLSLIAILTPEQLNSIIVNLTDFIGHVERPIATKEGWNSIFS